MEWNKEQQHAFLDKILINAICKNKKILFIYFKNKKKQNHVKILKKVLVMNKIFFKKKIEKCAFFSKKKKKIKFMKMKSFFYFISK